MKNTTIYIFATLLILGSTYQACCEACISKLTIDANKHATDAGALPIVKTYIIPSKFASDVDPEGFCGKVFEKHGTCCNQADLKKRADAWSFRLKSRADKIMKGFDKMDTITGHIGQIKTWTSAQTDLVASTIRVLEGSPHDSASLGPIGTGKPKHHLEKPSNTGLTEINNLFENIEKGDNIKRKNLEQKAKNEHQECHNKLMEMRKAALCMRCSGIADEYYDSAAKSYKVDQKVCSSLIDKCAIVFAAVAEANSLYTSLAILKKAKGGTVSTDAENDVVTNDQLTKWKNCGDDKSACLKDMTKVNELCGQISLSIDNQALEGNLATFSEGIKAGEDIGNNNNIGLSAVTDFFSGFRLLSSKSHSNFQRTLATTTSDDGYGYAVPSTTGADLEDDFSDSNGQQITGIIVSLGFILTSIVIV